MTFTLLLTCVGGELAPHVIRTLKHGGRRPVRVVGVDISANATGRHFVDRFTTVPRGTDPAYVEAIARLVAEEGVNLVLPTSDEEALALSAARSAIETGACHLACADAATLQLVSNKADAYDRFAELGLPTPDWMRATTLDELADSVKSFVRRRSEAVVKPASDRGGRGVCVIRADLQGGHALQGGRELHMDLATFLDRHLGGFATRLPAVVMQRLVEPVYDIDMLAWRGRPIHVVPRRRVESAMPNEGHVFIEDATLSSLGRRLVEKLELSWLYDCDVMYDADAKPCILEINPRPSGSIGSTITAGVPLLDDLIALSLGEEVPPASSPVGQVVIPYKALARAATKV
ncbi:MAG: hypothetical protein FJX53_03505 [Alphaproteobacteria bacterium]|nr:hypothetical protein [Alphaproteobacteria bacterium]